MGVRVPFLLGSWPSASAHATGEALRGPAGHAAPPERRGAHSHRGHRTTSVKEAGGGVDVLYLRWLPGRIQTSRRRNTKCTAARDPTTYPMSAANAQPGLRMA